MDAATGTDADDGLEVLATLVELTVNMGIYIYGYA